ncbi:PEP/pyruvate-binding domain-containing protein [Kribbella sp. NPDC004875]|uniref:PEP/pyruvate-binding domain-containing protein n=1 Tax=Kribbella sp. NPDC004875 TaxID=3364107 RepID=UPI0036A6502C
MLVPLTAATPDRCGAKAATLGTLLRAGLPVPDGVVIPFNSSFGDGLGRWLESVGNPPVAVRSSASNEDTAGRSAAGQHDSFLGVQGVAAVADAVRACLASLWSPRATAYRGASDASMAVIVQLHVDADVSGVMFTDPAGSTLIESSWGLGPSVAEGRVTPDSYRVAPDGSVTSTIADKPTSLHREGSRVVTRDVPTIQRRAPTLSAAAATHLAGLAQQVTTLLGPSQDIEWALTGETPWLLQSRPITTNPPTPAEPVTGERVLTGTPGSRGTATGPARVVLGQGDFAQVRPGDILVCRFTDPAWTPLLTIAAGVVTETGGVLSHAAIVARERGIPAVLGVPHATTRLRNHPHLTIEGTTGTIHL